MLLFVRHGWGGAITIFVAGRQAWVVTRGKDVKMTQYQTAAGRTDMFGAHHVCSCVARDRVSVKRGNELLGRLRHAARVLRLQQWCRDIVSGEHPVLTVAEHCVCGCDALLTDLAPVPAQPTGCAVRLSQ